MVFACGTSPGEPPLPTGEFVIGEAVLCAEPTLRFERLTESAGQRGLNLLIEPPAPHACNPVPGSVVAQDLDGDGDIDLAFARPNSFPAVFSNDGAGTFSDLGRADPLPFAPQRPAFVLAALDLTDDGLPELLLAGPNYLLRAANLGGLVFGPFEALYDVPEYPWSCFSSMSWGDVDGDLDVMLGGLFGVPHDGWSETPNDDGPWTQGSRNVLLLADDDAFTPHASDLGPAPSPSLSFLTTFTDRDGDGWRDFAVSAGPVLNFESVRTTVLHPDHPNALWRGTGVARFEDRSAASDFRSTEADYGLVSADFAGDGYREVVTAPWSGAPKLYDNPCGAEAWLEVELVGPAGNREGWGARLEASGGDWRHTEDLHNLLGVGQSPSRFPLGLGALSRVDSLRILWPDGPRNEIEGVPVRRTITAIHPSALD
jgi:hypothetical protein